MMLRHATTLYSAVVLCSALGCTVKTENGTDTAAADTLRVTSPAVRRDTSLPSSSAGTSFTITPTGYGPLRVGMTVAQAASALGGGIGAPAGYSGGCGYAALVKAPRGLAIMLEDGKIARFEIRSGGITTAEGARIGDTESRIKSLYAGRVTTTPHKYLPGAHYLTVASSSDPNARIVFETDGSKVTEFRSGRIPAVELVERCG
ncbi:MAG: hypothetical protein ACJ794_00315 [Gemmatimonadaceae bacterium]